MSAKEIAYSMLDTLTEEELNAIIVILTGMTKGKKNNIKTADTEKYQTVSDEEVAFVSKRLIEKNLEAYRELAK
ncbi:MAG: type II toxin-antitoxin system Phd/YefM family antitoxin [Ruminiclostridium sp.]|nr:type II toxin-antitoxin system Phd/YefM family antitoxin [Ruminiclostridium sp.]